VNVKHSPFRSGKKEEFNVIEDQFRA